MNGLVLDHDAAQQREHDCVPASRRALIACLRKCRGQPLFEGLAERFEACRPDAPCNSAACPQCSRAGRRPITSAIKKYLDGKAERGPTTIASLTIIPVDGVGWYHLEEHEREIRRWKMRLGRVGVTWFIGASDWYANRDVEELRPIWVHYFRGFAAASDGIADLAMRLAQQFPSSKILPHPVQVQPWDGTESAIDYMLENRLWRRSGSGEVQRFTTATDGMCQCPITDKRPLLSYKKGDLLVYLDRIGLPGRLILRGVTIVDVPTVVERVSKVRGPRPAP